MNKLDLLLEVGLEEIPARFAYDAMKQLASKTENLLKEKHIPYGTVQSFATPRRLAVLIEDVQEKQDDIEEEVKGPSKKVALDAEGNWTKAAIGFTKGQGKSVEDIYFKEINGVEYVHINKFTKGQQTIEILSALEEVITSLLFPKNMRWANFDLRFIRPIRWIVALFGNEVIDLEITDVKSGRTSQGHRFLGKPVEIQEPKQYKSLMLSEYVMADYDERKAEIREQLSKLASEQNWIIPIDENLLEEVTNLVEYPTVLFGTFDPDYLKLPKEVLITTMREHQRYFPVVNKTGELLPYFVTVRNGNKHQLEKVAKGNEKVLRARLQDAVFFFEEDQKLSIDTALERLKNVVYHEEIGTFNDKLIRIQKLAKFILSELNIQGPAAENTMRAAMICKFDLVTQMVDEFTELQGVMGEYYAKIAGESQEVAQAINEHYMPRNADGELPASLPGAIVSIADKLDTLASFFALNLIPTGSADPYSLRRQATGIVQILSEQDWNLDFTKLLKEGIKLTEQFNNRSETEVFEDLLSFFKLRLKHIMNENQIRYDIIDAVLDAPITNVKNVLNKAILLNKKKDDSEFKENVEALSRVINISNKAETVSAVSLDLFENESEKRLYEQYLNLFGQLNVQIPEEEYFQLLIGLKPFINDYFENTMVMAENEKVRNNRLSFMKQLSVVILEFAHFQNILVK